MCFHHISFTILIRIENVGIRWVVGEWVTTATIHLESPHFPHLVFVFVVFAVVVLVVVTGDGLLSWIVFISRCILLFGI